MPPEQASQLPSVWEWEIHYTRGSKRSGASGQTTSEARARTAVEQALKELPGGVTAKGHLDLVQPLVDDRSDTAAGRRVAAVERTADGEIVWHELGGGDQ